MLRGGAKEAGELPPRRVEAKPETLTGRGRGFGEGGAVRLAVGVVGSRNGRTDGPPVVDSIRLDAEQAAAFAPPKDAKAGDGWAVPADVARLFTPALSPMTDPIFSPTPADATTAKVTAVVERVADGVTVVRYAGRWETAHDRDGDPKFPIRTAATGEGVAAFDAKTGKPKEMVWVFTGTYRVGAESARATAASAEWAAGP